MRQFCLQVRKTRQAQLPPGLFCPTAGRLSTRMSDPKTSQPVTIDTLEFAREGRRLTGEVDIRELGRLADSLFARDGKLAFTLVGAHDAKNRPVLRVHVDGDLTLRCQRCLRALPYRLLVDSQLLVLTPQMAQTAEELAELDGIPADRRTDVAALIEDEALLALPMAPRHADGVCEVTVENTQPEASPFATLRRLKRS
jgi:uncharacterized protein